MKSSPATMYIVLPSFSRLIHLTIQEDGIKRQSWLFLWENYHKKLFLKSEKTFLEYRAAKAAVVLPTTTTETGFKFRWLLYVYSTTQHQCCACDLTSADVYLQMGYAIGMGRILI